MMITHFALNYKNRILQTFLIITLGLFCYASARNIATINDDITPKSPGNVEAMFYIENPETGSLTCIGDGLIKSAEEISGDALAIASTIISAPDYSIYIPNNASIRWNRISTSNGMPEVFGLVENKNNALTLSHNWADTSIYDSKRTSIIQSITPEKTIYFSSSGNDSNSGTDQLHPKKNPTNYLRKGNSKILLKSGDIFTLNYNLTIGKNTIISTYGGNKRAVINWVPINSQPFLLYDNISNIYSAKLDSITDAHYNISWIKLLGSQDVNWQRVFDYSELNKNNDFFVDLNNSTLYLKSNLPINNSNFSYASSAGGITFKNTNNCMIENIEIVGGGLGININNADNIIVQKCYVHHVGGIEAKNSKDKSSFRYGNGIQIWANNTNNIYVYDNYVSDCFDAGISPQISGEGNTPSDSIYIYNNYVNHCAYDIEFFEHNRDKSVPITNVVIVNNILTNASDITNGYRYATYGYTSYFCSWSSLSDNTRFNVSNNIGYGTEAYAFAFYEESPENVNQINDNTLFVLDKDDVKDCVKNYKLYTGDDSEIIPLETLSEQRFVETYIDTYTSTYDTQNLFFSYLAIQ